LKIDPKSLDDSLSVLDQTIYTPAYFQKLASANIVPRSQEEALEFLQLGHALRDRVDAHHSKQAASRVEQLRQLRASLTGQSAASLGFGKQAAFSDFGRQAAANPQIADAIMHVIAAQAQAA